MIRTGYATREGTALDNADSASVYVLSDGTVGAAVIDGIGHGPHTSRTAPLLAETAARYSAHRGPLPGLLAAALLVADEGPDGEEADAVAVAARVDATGSHVAWVGDCRAYGWNGQTLTLHTTDHTMGEWVRTRLDGPPIEISRPYDSWVRLSLSTATVATTHETDIPDPVLILVSDGVHDQVPADTLTALARAHADDPQTLATALVTAATTDHTGYRDDATAIVLTLPAHQHHA
ncbi:hypothetical protein [Streptomyces sp. NPDC005955]|uniref:hypothetical protein n=1 Tax=Streptomyces sp. NPDC005955 TaxID=3364738 RepID=UPI00369D3094